MKKILYFLMVFILLNYSKAQVGINTTTPHSSSSIDIQATNKGVSFPQIFLKSKTDVTTIPNPKESLLVYNTNDNLTGGKGLYFWNGKSWDFFFSDLNESNLKNLTKSYSVTNNTTYSLSAPANYYDNTNHSLQESIYADLCWTVLTDATKTIKIDRASNEIVFTITGMIQANNYNTGGSTLNVIGIFIDDKLVDIKPFDLKFSDRCAFRSFKVYGYTQNVAVGNHTVKFAIRNRSSSQDTTIAFGGRNNSSTCNNILTNDEAKISGVILVNQPFNF